MCVPGPDDLGEVVELGLLDRVVEQRLAPVRSAPELDLARGHVDPRLREQPEVADVVVVRMGDHHVRCRRRVNGSNCKYQPVRLVWKELL